MRKKERHEMIQHILKEHVIEKQEDLVAILLAKGADVTQATISRDMKEMHLIKVPSEQGGYHYSMPERYENDVESRFARFMQDGFIEMHQKDYFVIVKLLPGNGQAIGSYIDQLGFQGILGTVAGDDTVLIICENPATAKIIEAKFLQVIS